MWRINRLEAAADAALQAGDFANALPILQETLSLRPGHPETLFALGRTERRRGRYDLAATHFRAYLKSGGIPEAVALENELHSAQSGNLTQEKRLQLYVENDHPDTALILEALAQGYLLNFRLGDAIAVLDRLIERQPGFLSARLWRGQALLHSRNFFEAADAFRSAVELDPNHEPARFALAEVLLVLTEPKEAHTHFAWLAAKRSNNPTAHTGLAKASVQLGQLEDGRRHADTALALDGNHVAALVVRGNIELQSERPADAEPWLRRAIEDAPFERDVVHSFVQCLQQQDKRLEAAKWQQRIEEIVRQQRHLGKLTQRIRDEPNNPNLRAEVGQTFLDIGNEREGRRWLESALRADPNHFVSRQLLLGLDRKTETFEKAAESKR